MMMGEHWGEPDKDTYMSGHAIREFAIKVVGSLFEYEPKVLTEDRKAHLQNRLMILTDFEAYISDNQDVLEYMK